jgi:hypothetical protein
VHQPASVLDSCLEFEQVLVEVAKNALLDRAAGSSAPRRPDWLRGDPLFLLVRRKCDKLAFGFRGMLAQGFRTRHHVGEP